MVWLEFILCGSFLTFFAYNLCKEGVILSEKTNIEKGIIGMLFLAIATSFPEIVTASAAIFSLGRIGLGYGDIMGSVMVNLMILVFLDYYVGRGRILLKVSPVNKVTGLFVLVAGVLILGASLVRLSGVNLPVIGVFGIENIAVILVYVAALGIIRKSGTKEEHEIYPGVKEPFWQIWGKFIFFLVIVMFLGVWMAKSGEKIVVETGLSQTFTGTLLLGFATSLPEIIVSFAAIRASSIDMAVGNILGSNLFDLCIVPFLDLLTKKPILGVLTTGQVVATALVVFLCGITVAGLYVRKDTSRRINWDTGLIFIVGFLGFVILYFVK
jgi:cation:H+ antiporter